MGEGQQVNYAEFEARRPVRTRRKNRQHERLAVTLPNAAYIADAAEQTNRN
jgi:hypothetical protein